MDAWTQLSVFFMNKIPKSFLLQCFINFSRVGYSSGIPYRPLIEILSWFVSAFSKSAKVNLVLQVCCGMPFIVHNCINC